METDTQQTAITPRFTGSTVFMGPHGLRAGWGALLFCFFVGLYGFLTLQAAKFAMHAMHYHGNKDQSIMTPGSTIVAEVLMVLVSLLATFTMSKIEGRKLRDYGFAPVALGPRVLGGIVAGFSAISALMLLLWGTHLAVLGGVRLSIPESLQYGAVWFLAFALVGLFEESVLRGYLLFTLRRGIGFWPAAILLSIAFGVIHKGNAGETPVGLFSAAAIGLVFCFSIWYTRSLWWAVGFHAAWDWGESFFWGTADSGGVSQGRLLNEHPAGNPYLSGGPTGPEGSLYILAVVLLVSLGIWLHWRNKPALTV
jgi:uncharacterized protein